MIFSFKIDESLKALMEMEALKRRITQGAVLREALAHYLAESGHAEVKVKKREREVVKSRPLDMHDGVMFVAQVREVVQKEKDTIKTWRKLDNYDYDHFLSLVRAEKKIAKTYEHSKWMLRELVRLAEELENEKALL